MGLLDAEHYDSHAEMSNPLRNAKETRMVLATFHHLDGRTSSTFVPYLGTEHEHDGKIIADARRYNINNYKNPVTYVEYNYKVAKKEWSAFELPYEIKTGYVDIDITESLRRIKEYLESLRDKRAEAKDCYERTANDYRYADAHEAFKADVKRYDAEISYLTRQLTRSTMSEDAERNAEEDKLREIEEQIHEEKLQYRREQARYDDMMEQQNLM